MNEEAKLYDRLYALTNDIEAALKVNGRVDKIQAARLMLHLEEAKSALYKIKTK